MHVLAVPAIKSHRCSRFRPFVASRRLRATITATSFALCAVVPGGATPAVAYASPVAQSPTNGGGLISITPQACAPGWVPPRSGLSELTVYNTTPTTPYRVEIVSASTNEIYGDLQMVAPGTRALLEALLPPGRYSVYCLAASGPSRRSALGAVSGPPVSGAHPYLPLSAKALGAATVSYHRYLAGWVSKLAANTSSLCAAVAGGRMSTARQQWLGAQLDFDRMGGAPSLFGPLAGEVDGSPLGLEGGAASPYFLGLRRVEYGLWNGQSRAQLLPVCAQLVPAVGELAAEFAHLIFPPTVLATAAVSQLEQTYELDLTGQLDEGAHADLASAWAQVLAAQAAISAISGSTSGTGASVGTRVILGAAMHSLESLAASLSHFRSVSGQWATLSSLGRSQREALDSQFQDALDAVALTPALVEGQAAVGGGPSAPPVTTTTTTGKATGSTTTPARAASSRESAL